MEESPAVVERVTLRPAVVGDVELILDLVNELATAGEMLPRSPSTTVERLRDFVVAEVDGEFAGCGALALVWTDIAEVRSIAVKPEYRKLGVGKRMAESLLAEAKRLGGARVVAFAYVPGFSEAKFEYVQSLYQSNAFLAIFAAAFTPIPYKVFTIAAGVCSVPLGSLVVASALGRGARFFLVATATYFFGAAAKRFLDRYLELITLLLLVAIVAGFLALRFLLPG